MWAFGHRLVVGVLASVTSAWMAQKAATCARQLESICLMLPGLGDPSHISNALKKDGLDSLGRWSGPGGQDGCQWDGVVHILQLWLMSDGRNML